jgi:HEPN domain-containing protein
LKSFISGAVRYINSREWRTSIVLSAITVESILAELYEDASKEPAPDTPLGDLFRKVKEKIDIPPDIVDAINMTNEARIAAVHRSPSPISDRDATNALFGAIKLTLWYAFG